MVVIPLSAAELTAQLRRLGLGSGDLVMVHASLRAIGPVVGRADGVIDAIEATVGPTGTMLMVPGARDDFAWVNDHPEAEREDLLREAEPFDYLTTPADPEIGTLVEVFRQRPTTMASNHPEGRYAASGRLARELTSSVPWDDYHGPGSPLQALVDEGGKVLRLGADLDTVTLLHFAEYLADVPSKRRVRRHRKVVSPAGPKLVIVETLDDSNGIVDHPGEDYFSTILRSYLATGRAATGLVGGARSELIDAADLVGFGATWMTRHLSP